MSINIQIDSKALLAQLEELGESKQGPFILSKSLNQLAKVVQTNLLTDMKESLRVRRKQWLNNQVKIRTGTWATKYRLMVKIELDTPAEFLSAFETGEEHVPYAGHSWLAVPSSKVFGKSIIMNDNPLKPKNLMLTQHHGLIQGLERTFLVKTKKKGTPLILQRTSKTDKGKRRRGTNTKTGVRLLYTLIKASMRPHKIHWYDTANMTVQNEQYGIFSFVMEQALIDAKKS